MAPRRARTSAWLSCTASPFIDKCVAGRHLDPVASEIGVTVPVRCTSANEDRIVYWAGFAGRNLRAEYKFSAARTTESAMCCAKQSPTARDVTIAKLALWSSNSPLGAHPSRGRYYSDDALQVVTQATPATQRY